MKVYLVVWSSQMDYEIGGIFRDREVAQSMADSLQEQNGYGYSSVDEYEV